MLAGSQRVGTSFSDTTTDPNQENLGTGRLVLCNIAVSGRLRCSAIPRAPSPGGVVQCLNDVSRHLAAHVKTT